MDAVYSLTYIHTFLAVAVIALVFLFIFFWTKPFEVVLTLLFLRPLINLTREIKFSTGFIEIKFLWLYTMTVIFLGLQYLVISKKITIPRRLIIAYVLFLIVCLISLSYTSNVYQGIGDFFRYISAIVYFVLFYELIGDKEDFLKAIKIISFSLLLTLPFSIYNLLSGTGFIEKSTGLLRITSTFMTPNSYGFYLSFIILVNLFIISQREVGHKFLFIILLALSFVTLLLTWTRTAWIAFFFGFFIFCFLKSKRLAFISLIIIFIIALLPFVQERFMESFTQREYGMSSWQWRLMVWETLLKAFTTSPFCGFGLGSKQDVLLRFGGWYNWPHNDYLRLAIELGILGLFLFCFILVIFIKMFWHSYLKATDNFMKDANILALSILGSFCVISMAANQLTDVTLLMYVFSLLGLTCKLNKIYAR